MILHVRDIPAPRTLHASICVIGAGPVGITLALELARAGRDVLLLEAGEGGKAAPPHDAYRGTVADPALHGPLDLCRVRGLGGSSAVWAGRSAPFDPIDVERRPWIADSGWPIDHAACPLLSARRRLVRDRRVRLCRRRGLSTGRCDQ